MNLLFMSNWQKTELFAPIAKLLQEKGHEIYWVATSPHYREYLVQQGFEESRILWLRRDHARSLPQEELDFAKLAQFERLTGHSVRDFALMDRVVAHWSGEEIHRYGAYVLQSVLRHLEQHRIQVVFGEPATFHELVTLMACEGSGRSYIAPFSLRLPVTRFICWKGYTETDFFGCGPSSLTSVSEEWIEAAREVREKVAVKQERPFYWYRNNASPKLNFDYFRRLGRGFMRAAFGSRVDSNMYSLRSMLKHHRLHLRPFNYWLARLRWNAIFDRARSGERYVLYTLPKQPEYTIDVLGSRYSNQYETLKALARSLPSNVMLYVKEHRNSLGDRSLGQLLAMKRLPGVRLIDPMEDIHALISGCEAVVSPAGTSSLEGALHGRPSYTLAGSFMNGFSTCERLEGPWELGQKLAHPPEHDLEHDLRYLGLLLSNSFEGIITDYTGPDNHRNVAEGLHAMLQANFAEKQLTEIA
jgi:hypothetical protein